MKHEFSELLAAAKEAQQSAHCPFSQYPVGAAVLSQSGKVFKGCNVENASYGATICAERVAIGSMVADGERSIRVIAVATKDGGTPCGVCRQVIAEFAPDCIVLTVNQSGEIQEFTIHELLPHPFTSKSLM